MSHRKTLVYKWSYNGIHFIRKVSIECERWTQLRKKQSEFLLILFYNWHFWSCKSLYSFWAPLEFLYHVIDHLTLICDSFLINLYKNNLFLWHQALENKNQYLNYEIKVKVPFKNWKLGLGVLFKSWKLGLGCRLKIES